jgi:S-methylmethionine-dependent homocysteine/selenocysteine methylase
MSIASRLDERLQSGDVVVIDGGMGSELQARGIPMNRAAWCALANLDHPELVRQIHEDNIRAGAEVIIANTYPATRLMLRGAGLEDRFVECNRRAVAAAREARERTGHGDVAVAGSISLGVAVDFMERTQPSPEGSALRDAFSEQAGVLADAGVDLLVLEMIMSSSYGVAAVETALETGLPVWLGTSVRLSPDGAVVTLGQKPVPFDALLSELLRPSLSAVTIMHSAIASTGPALEVLARQWSGPRGAYPESGDFTPPNWIFSELMPEEFAPTAASWAASGAAQIIGGCCGMGPSFVEAIRAALP